MSTSRIQLVHVTISTQKTMKFEDTTHRWFVDLTGASLFSGIHHATVKDNSFTTIMLAKFTH
jgi:hypothetical protein